MLIIHSCSDSQLPEVKDKLDTSMFSSEFTSLPIISPSSYNRGFAEEIAFPVMILFEYDKSQGFSYVDSTIQEQDEEKEMEQEPSDDNSYMSASISEYSEDDMCEDYYE